MRPARVIMSFSAALAAATLGCGCGNGGSSTVTGKRHGTVQSVGGTTQVSGVGHDGLATGAVASVAGSKITEAVLDHWVAVQASTNYELIPKGPIPTGVVPDPPAFRACVAYLRSGGQGATESSRPRTNAELFRECETHYHWLRNHVLGILISFKWWEAKANELGIHISEAKIVKEFARSREEMYHSIAKYEVYLRRTGQTLADEYQRVRADLLTVALREHFLAAGKAAFIAYLQSFSKEWAAKTSCEPSDLVPNCREYRGSIEPEARI